MKSRILSSFVIRILAFIIAFACIIQYSEPPLQAQTRAKKKISQKKEKVPKKKSPQKSATLKSKKTAEEIPDEYDSMSGTIEWKVVLKDDNGNIELPPRYRTWWYVRLDGVNSNNITKFHVEGDGFQGASIVIPVYSYDRKTWRRLKPENIERGEESAGLYNYTIKKRFDSSTVWLARYYPYTYSRLKKFLKKYEKNPYLKVETIGKSAHGRQIFMAAVTDPNTDDATKKRIWIHARTHPSETGCSFVVEGLIDFLLSDCNIHCKEADLSGLIFNIVPMLNVDGVVEGNARVTPDSSYDLERMWLIDPKNHYMLLDTCPPEVKALHSAITKLNKKGPEFIAALNLHTKNAFPTWRPFIYTNFKRENKELGAAGDSMFFKQLSFTKLLSDAYECDDTLNVRPSFERELPMHKKNYPEAWWWLNFKDKVMAATLEVTSGYDGCYEEWATYMDHLKLGEALAIALQKYCNYFIKRKWFRYEAHETDIEKLMKYYIGNGSRQ